MDLQSVEGYPDTYIVDNELFGTPGALSTYIVDAERPALLDAGTPSGAERILEGLRDIETGPEDVAYVFVSHVHLDHAAGTNRLLEACPNATVVVHERGLPYLIDPAKLDRLLESVEQAMGFADPYGDPDVVPADRCRAVSGGESFDLGDRTLDIYDAPGHAPHHYVAHDSDSGLLFAADAIGAFQSSVGVVPSTPPPSFDLEANLETVDRLRNLDPSLLLFSHFGPGEDALGELDDYEAVLPEWVDAVATARERVGDDVDAVLDELRPEWQSPTLRRDVVGVCQYLDRTAN